MPAAWIACPVLRYALSPPAPPLWCGVGVSPPRPPLWCGVGVVSPRPPVVWLGGVRIARMLEKPVKNNNKLLEEFIIMLWYFKSN